MKPNFVEVEYIESGSFQGSEEEVYLAGIKYGEICVVLKKKDFEYLMELAEEEELLARGLFK